MTSRELIRWSRLHEKRSRTGVSSGLVVSACGALFAALVSWRVHERTAISARKTWVAGALAAFGLAFMRVPFHLYWRPDAALLAQLPIGGGPLFDTALLRCVRAAAATSVVVLAGAAPLAQVSVELFARHAIMTATLFALAAAFLPAVATWAASLVAGSTDALELATKLGGAPVRDKTTSKPPGSSSAILGALPGFASTVAIVFVIIVAPWLTGRETALEAPTVLAGLAAVSALALIAMRAAAPRLMGTILRDVSALDRQRLATLEILEPTALERAVARLIASPSFAGARSTPEGSAELIDSAPPSAALRGPAQPALAIGDAALVYRKDARLMRRRYPMAYALGALAFLVLVIVGLARPADPVPWLVAVLAGAAMYGATLAVRLRRPPIEIPRLAATLPIAPAALARAKLAWVVAWATVFVAIPLVFAAARLL